jgi:hypothetical protein
LSHLSSLQGGERLLPWRIELDEDERLFFNSIEVAGTDVNNVGGTLGDGDGDESEGGERAKERGELHDGRRK